MHRPLSIAIIASLLFTSVVMADDKPSPAVKRILDKTVAEVKKNRQEFDKANAKPLGDARVELQDLSTKLIKDGKTVDATAVLKQIENLEADVMRMANAPAPVGGGGKPAQQKPLLERLSGKWGNPNDPFIRVVQANGEFVELRKDSGRQHSTGKIVSTNDEVAIATLGNGWVLQLRLSADEQVVAVLFRDPVGKEVSDGVVMRRVP